MDIRVYIRIDIRVDIRVDKFNVLTVDDHMNDL